MRTKKNPNHPIHSTIQQNNQNLNQQSNQYETQTPPISTKKNLPITNPKTTKTIQTKNKTQTIQFIQQYNKITKTSINNQTNTKLKRILI